MRRLAQGHRDTQLGGAGDRTSNLAVTELMWYTTLGWVSRRASGVGVPLTDQPLEVHEDLFYSHTQH